MKFSLQQYVEALYQTLAEANPKDQNKIIANFIDILKNNGDLSKYETIVSAYEEYDRKIRGVKQIELTTAHDMEMNKGIIDQLNDVVGKNVEIKKKVDSSLIGGVILKIDDTQIDGSMKRQLSKLNDALTNN